MRTVLGPALPDLLRRDLPALIARWQWVLPPWIHTVNVLWQEEDDGVPVAIETHEEYRCAKLIIRPSFLTAEEPTRSEYVLHELLHAAIQPTKSVVFDLAEATQLPDVNPALWRWVQETTRQANERAVQDLADAILAHEVAP